MMLACRIPGQLRSTLKCASRNSWSRPDFTLKRTALKAVILSSAAEAQPVDTPIGIARRLNIHPPWSNMRRGNPVGRCTDDDPMEVAVNKALSTKLRIARLGALLSAGGGL